MTHRRLTIEELTALESDFVKFLALQGIDAPGWLKIKEDHESSELLIDEFSRLTWLRIVENTRYLEEIDSTGIKLYKCEDDQIFLIGIYAEQEGTYDFLAMDVIFQAMKANPEHFRVVRGYKAYSPDRHGEIFKLIHANNAHVSQGQLYEHLTATASS
jgi:hypothetical protein